MASTRPVFPTRSRVPERRLPLNAPVRAWALSEWALLPLRIFLGATFVYASLQKLANPNFFHVASPISIQAQMLASSRVSPIRFLLSHLLRFAVPIGWSIALGELLIGVGVLVGLWTRAAALGGAILSFVLFLTVSFHASPYFTGADIVFFFAWLPFVLAGGGTRLSVDAWIATRAAKAEAAPAPGLVPVPFATIQQLCGHFNRGRCNAREGLRCEAAVCPVLLGPRAPFISRVSIDAVERRSLVLGTAAAAMIGGTAVLGAAAVAGVGRAIGGAKPASGPNQLGAPASSSGTTPSTSTPASTPASTSGPSASALGTLLGPVKDVPVGQAAQFQIPSSGDPGIVVQPVKGQFEAYNAVCPHAGCTVGYYAANQVLACPCHGSEFQLTTGAVLMGPAPHGLTKLTVVEGPDGNLYLK